MIQFAYAYIRVSHPRSSHLYSPSPQARYTARIRAFDCNWFSSADFPTIKYISRNDGTRGGCSKGAPPPFQPAGLPLFSRGHARRNGIHRFQLARTTTGQQLTVEETGVPVKNQWPIPPRNLGESGEMHGSRRGSIFSSSIKDERKRKVGAAHDESSLAIRTRYELIHKSLNVLDGTWLTRLHASGPPHRAPLSLRVWWSRDHLSHGNILTRVGTTDTTFFTGPPHSNNDRKLCESRPERQWERTKGGGCREWMERGKRGTKRHTSVPPATTELMRTAEGRLRN